MIRGVVNSRNEAIVRIRVRGPGHPGLDVDAIVDSGYNAALALPGSTVAGLGLRRKSRGGAVLADGTVRQFDIYLAEVLWDGIWQPVLLPTVGDEALLGMGLLAGHELRISVVPDGAVEITPLP
jgi:clan AA aspartic protease